jgi:hypothetical protein
MDFLRASESSWFSPSCPRKPVKLETEFNRASSALSALLHTSAPETRC